MVSVIIPSYNRAHYISEAIESVLQQTYNDYEVIVVDDGSTDDTAKFLKKYAEQIKYIYQGNAGAAAARNKGIANAKGEYIAFLDSDDVWAKEKLETQVRVMNAFPELGLIFSDTIIVSEGKTPPDLSLQGGNWLSGKALVHKIPRTDVGDNSFIFQKSPFCELLQENFIPTNTVLVRRNCLEKVGLFDEKLRRAQDADLWLRISRNFKLGYTNLAFSEYRQHQNNISKESKWGYEAKVKIYAKLLSDTNPLTPKEATIVRCKLAEAYFQLGRWFLKNEYDFKKARKYLLKSIRYRFRFKIPLYLLLTLLSKKQVSMLKTVYYSYDTNYSG